MVNYQVDPGVLSARVPRGTELDLWRGRCFVSVVGFCFTDTRVLGIAVPFHTNFIEVNLRFYVRRVVGGLERRGVVFVKEIVPRRAIAWVANVVYNERYVALPMSSEDSGGEVSYSWRHRGRTHRVGVAVTGDPHPPSEDSEARFITEHYWGYATHRDGSTVEYQVEHPPWRVWRAVRSHFECDVISMYGAAFERCLLATPSSAFLAEGATGSYFDLFVLIATRPPLTRK